MQCRVRILEVTFSTLEETAERIGIRGSHGPGPGRPCGAIGPLLDFIARNIKEVSAVLPQAPPEASAKKWRLRADQVRLIRVSTDKQASIAAEYRVDVSTISRIKAGKAYEWVK